MLNIQTADKLGGWILKKYVQLQVHFYVCYGGKTMILSALLISFGICGSFFMFTLISNDWPYTYAPPFTDHEITMMFLFIMFVVMTMVGVVLMIATVWKKNNQDRLTKIQNMGINGQTKKVCPACGLNLADETKVCPKCGNIIKED